MVKEQATAGNGGRLQQIPVWQAYFIRFNAASSSIERLASMSSVESCMVNVCLTARECPWLQ